MRTLILSCNTGEGHNSCAKAIKEYYDTKQELCIICDALSFISEHASKFISDWHVRIYRHFPDVFRFGYRYAEKHDTIFQENSMLYRLITLGSERMYQYILEGQYDSIICTHVFSALMLTEVLKRHPMEEMATCFVATDYTCSPSTKDSALDCYFIPDIALSYDFESPAISSSQIVGSGIPVRQMFYTHTGKAEAKRRYGIDPSHKHLLMACGSMGCGPIYKLAKCLSVELRPDQDLTIICGSNEKLQQRLEKRYAAFPNIHVQGYIRDMASLLDSGDLYLTKPGGISVSEAAQKKLPMVFIDAAAGCEEYNKSYFLERGGAKTGLTVEELTDICVSLLSDEEKLQEMIDDLSRIKTTNAAQMIYEYMQSKHQDFSVVTAPNETENHRL